MNACAHRHAPSQTRTEVAGRASPHATRGTAALVVALQLVATAAAQGGGHRGEALPPAALGPNHLESMADIILRDRAAPPTPRVVAKEHDGTPGEWFVPARDARTARASSGQHCAINRWGDLQMAIGFAQPVDVEGASFTAQGGRGACAENVVVVGFRAGAEVGRSASLALAEQPAWHSLALKGVDRIEFHAQATSAGPAWYAIDDLTYRVPGASRPVVIDFDDLAPRTALTDSLYRGLRWERGAGKFAPDAVRAIPPPLAPPGAGAKTTRAPAAGAGAAPMNHSAAALPNIRWAADGPRIFDPGSAVIPSDSSGAAGPAHFVSLVNSNLSVWRKDTKARVVNVALTSFFALQAGVGIGDVRAVFDPHTQRFVIAAMTGPNGRIYLAMSSDGDPTGQWFKTSILAAFGSDADKWPDFPTLGVDRDGIYLAALMVGGNYPMTIWAVDKAPLLQQNPSLGTVTAWRNLPWEGAIQPCLTHGDPGVEYLVSRLGPQHLRLRKIERPLTAPTLREAGLIAVPWQDSPPDAPALGSATAIDTGDFRPAHATFRAGSIWTAQGTVEAGRAAVRWYQIDPAAMRLVQHGTLADPVMSYFHPSIVVNVRGDVLIACNGSHAGQYVGAYYSGRVAGDPQGQMAPPALLRQGDGPYERPDGGGNNRWGDYSYCIADPSDDGLWTIQEYARGGNDWGTWMARMEFDWFRYGDGWPGTRGVPDLRMAFGAPRIGGVMFFGLDNSYGSTTAGVLLLGAQRAMTRIFDGTVLVLPAATVALQIPAAGQSLVLSIPNNPALVRESVFLQVAQSDPGASAGISFTRGVELRIGQ